MTPNQLQFQSGLSLSNFLHDYGTEARCEAALEKSRWPKGYICPVCESRSHCIVWHGKVKTFQCNRCHTQVTLTAGTIFHVTKLPLVRWFQAMYFMTFGAEASHRSLLPYGLAGETQVFPSHERTGRDNDPVRSSRS